MHFTAGSSKNTWQPVMTADTTNPYYWLNWRVLLCSLWILASVIVSAVLIWKYEGHRGFRAGGGGRTGGGQEETMGTLYDDESWRPCLKAIHPAWLLAFRVASFFVLMALLTLNVVVDGRGIFYYYTQWTFVLVTLYFGLGSLLSSYGCLRYLGMIGSHGDTHIRSDTERGTYVSPTSGSANDQDMIKSSVTHEVHNTRQVAGFWGYAFQIIYQTLGVVLLAFFSNRLYFSWRETNAGAVMLTDCVFWLIIFPFLAIKDYDLNLILIGMHSVNAVFLLGDTALNNLRFPWFRISYFLLWTSGFVIFQWIVHACVSVWWPYPFLDLSSPQAPIWYLVVAVMHIPCYAIFPLLLKMKHSILSTYFAHYLPEN